MDEIRAKDFPYKIEILTFEENQKFLPGYGTEFIRIGPKKYFFPSGYALEAANIYNLPLREDDIFIVTYPKSGTTLTQELIWLVCNNLDYEKAQLNLNERFPFLEVSTVVPLNNFTFTKELTEVLKKTMNTVQDVEDMPSPRFIKSHLPFSLLPPSLLDTAKVVYVVRDARDVAVSFYHHHRWMKMINLDDEFKSHWKYFVSDFNWSSKFKRHSVLALWGPYFAHVLEAWEKRNHPNLLFLSYEKITKDLSGAIKRVADFFGKTLAEEQVGRLTEHLRIDNFKKNKSVNKEDLQKLGAFPSDESFIRKGKAGGWRDCFDEEMTVQAEEWIEKNIRDTDFRFTHC